ncbi:hypothetical protein H2203_008615 [Taxawa tesnikishii (nom. ined.)]|nr:hypothetical protein H2203_008615 [Dothideales sp. JES 119]
MAYNREAWRQLRQTLRDWHDELVQSREVVNEIAWQLENAHLPIDRELEEYLHMPTSADDVGDEAQEGQDGPVIFHGRHHSPQLGSFYWPPEDEGPDGLDSDDQDGGEDSKTDVPGESWADEVDRNLPIRSKPTGESGNAKASEDGAAAAGGAGAGRKKKKLPGSCEAYWMEGVCPEKPGEKKCSRGSHIWLSIELMFAQPFVERRQAGQLPAHTMLRLTGLEGREKLGRDRKSAPVQSTMIGSRHPGPGSGAASSPATGSRVAGGDERGELDRMAAEDAEERRKTAAADEELRRQQGARFGPSMEKGKGKGKAEGEGEGEGGVML